MLLAEWKPRRGDTPPLGSFGFRRKATHRAEFVVRPGWYFLQRWLLQRSEPRHNGDELGQEQSEGWE